MWAAAKLRLTSFTPLRAAGAFVCKIAGLGLGYENPAISRGSTVAPEMSSARHDPPITADLRFY